MAERKRKKKDSTGQSQARKRTSRKKQAGGGKRRRKAGGSKKRKMGMKGKKGSKKKGKKTKKSTKEEKLSRREERKALFDYEEPLSGGTLEAAMETIARLATEPEARGYEREAGELRDALRRQINQQAGLGAQARGNVSDYYKRLASSEAQSLAQIQAIGQKANLGVGLIGNEAQQNIQGSAEMASEAIQDPMNVPEQTVTQSARDRLQGMVTEQSTRAAREQQAVASQVAGMGQDWASLSRGMAQANQMQGAATTGDISREIQNRIAELQSEYGPDIRGAYGQAADTRASYGDEALSALLQLREGERQYGLERAALGLQRKELKASTSESGDSSAYAAEVGQQSRKTERLKAQNRKKYLKGSRKQYGKLAGKKGKISRRGTREATAGYGQLAKLKGKESRKYLAAQGAAYGGGGGADYDKEEFQRAKDQYRGLPGSVRREIKGGNKQAQRRTVSFLVRNGGVNPAAARAVVRKVAGKRKKQQQRRRKLAKGFSSKDARQTFH